MAISLKGILNKNFLYVLAMVFAVAVAFFALPSMAAAKQVSVTFTIDSTRFALSPQVTSLIGSNVQTIQNANGVHTLTVNVPNGIDEVGIESKWTFEDGGSVGTFTLYGIYSVSKEQFVNQYGTGGCNYCLPFIDGKNMHTAKDDGGTPHWFNLHIDSASDGGASGGNTPPPPPPPAPQCRDGIDNDGDGLIDHPSDTGCSSADDDNEEDGVAYTHWNVGAWEGCVGYNTKTGQGGKQVREVTSYTDTNCCNDPKPTSARACDLPADYDLYDASRGDPNIITNTFGIHATFVGDQQVKFSSVARIGVSPVFSSHPNQSDVIFSVVGVNPPLPADTEYFFTPQSLSSSSYSSGTEFKVRVPRTNSGVYQITIKAVGGGVVKQGIVNMNVNLINPTFEEI